jgi:hypothetical protein
MGGNNVDVMINFDTYQRIMDHRDMFVQLTKYATQ